MKRGPGILIPDLHMVALGHPPLQAARSEGVSHFGVPNWSIPTDQAPASQPTISRKV